MGKNKGKIKGVGGNGNLIPIQPGHSGNPKGRPKGQRNYATIYREALIKLAERNNKTPDELEDDILSSGLLNARKGNYQFYKDVLDRIHGKPQEHSEIKISGSLNKNRLGEVDERIAGIISGVIQSLAGKRDDREQ